VLIPGARHELMMERDVYAGQFWAAFDAFVPGAGPLA
jgi:lysophospholipase